jgi:prolyl oligopeptidase
MIQMHRTSQFAFAIAFLLTPVAMPQNGGSPPVAPVRAVTDKYFGIQVADPYRYLENLKDPEVASWFKSQSDYTRAVLDRIPGRAELLSRVKMLDESASARVTDVQRLPGERYFYLKRLPTDDVAKLYTRIRLTGAETMLVDPAKLASKNSHSVISYYAPSMDGSYVAYGVAQGGSEEAVVHVLETATGREMGDVIDRARWGVLSWTPDARSFFYNRTQKLGPNVPASETELKSRVYLHRVGTPPDQDREVVGFGLSPAVPVLETDLPFVSTFPESQQAIAVLNHGVQNELTLYAAPLDSMDQAPVPWRKLCDVDDQLTQYAVRGLDLYFLTHKGASRYQVMHTRLDRPDAARADIVLAPSAAVIQSISAASDGLYAQLLDGGVGKLLRIPYGGKPETVSLPFAGAVSVATTDPRLPGVMVEMTSWTKATKIYAYDPGARRTTDSGLQPAGPFDDPVELESVEVKAPSYDGTLVPLSIVYKKGLKLDGENPMLLVGYGAYGMTSDPFFDPKLLAWLEQGAVYAVAHVRGGGDYGEDWHLAGKQLTKPNTWRDFIACAQYLVEHKYTSPKKLGIQGGSAGGILIGRSITERPDLFAAAIDGVPMSDALRFETEPNVPEFGSTKTLEGFEDLLAMSSYHHIRDGAAYPAVMVTTGFNDPRVAPWQAGKIAARLQAATESDNPVLLRVDYDAGHGVGSTKTQTQALIADRYSFLLWRLGVAGFQPK